MKNDNIVSEIKETSDYNKFEASIFQRPLRNLSNLKEFMKQYGFKYEYPIVVKPLNKTKYEILSGHHRFQAAKELMIPIKYLVSNDSHKITLELETLNKEWRLEDYLQSYVNAKNEHYVMIEEYQKKTNIPLSTVLFLMNDANGKQIDITNQFKAGIFVIQDGDFPDIIYNAIMKLKTHNIKIATQSKFVKALALCTKIINFKLAYCLDKLIRHSNKIESQSSIEKYIKMIEDIYNYNMKKDSHVSLVFEIKKQKMI